MGGMRRRVAALLVVLGCALAPLSVLAIWLRAEVLDTGAYVRTVSPLSADPAVRAAVARDVTNALFTRVDVAAEARRVLPRRASFLSVPLTLELRRVTDATVQELLATKRFQRLWATANRLAHTQLVRILEGKGEILVAREGTVSLDLRPVLDEARRRLTAAGIPLFHRAFPNGLATRFVLVDSRGLERTRRGVRLLNALAYVLPALTLLALGGGVALARDRRRAVLRAGLGLAAAAAVLGAGVVVARWLYLGHVAGPNLPRDAASAVFDTVVRYLRDGLLVSFALGLLVAAAAHAKIVRRLFRRRVTWVAANKRALEGGALFAGSLALLSWSGPTPGVLAGIAAAVLAAFAATELLGRDQ